MRKARIVVALVLSAIPMCVGVTLTTLAQLILKYIGGITPAEAASHIARRK